MSEAAATRGRPRPPAPDPYGKPLKSLAFVRALRKNPIAVFSREFYEKPAVFTETIIGRIVVVTDPDAVRRILIDNRDNYRRDSFQQRMLMPMVGGSLVTAESEAWRRQRRHIAPLFTPQMVDAFLPAMAKAAERMVADLKSRPDGDIIDTPAEMARAAVAVLGATIFGDGISIDHDEIARTLATYVDRVGRVDFADALGLPDWVPRINLWRTRRQRALFPRFVSEVLAARRRRDGTAAERYRFHPAVTGEWWRRGILQRGRDRRQSDAFPVGRLRIHGKYVDLDGLSPLDRSRVAATRRGRG